MKKRIKFLVKCTFSVAFCFSQLQLSLAEPTLHDRIVRNSVQRFMNNQEVPGVALGLYCQDRSHLYHFGMADESKNIPVAEDTIFEIASISKVFVSTLLAWEIQQNHLRLDDPVSPFLLELPKGSNRPIDRITFKHLATHTSSLPRGGSTSLGETNEEIMNYLAGWKPPYPIGSERNYSNSGFGLLGRAIQDASIRFYGKAMTFEELLARNITQPLQMEDTSVYVPQEKRNRYAQGHGYDGSLAENYADSPVWPGGGGVRSTLSDMMKFLRANLKSVTGSESIDHPARELIQAMEIAQTKVKVNEDLSAALGWETRKTTPVTLAKNGSNQGFSSFMAFIPKKKIGIVILTNKSAAKPPQLGNQILQKLLENQACNPN